MQCHQVEMFSLDQEFRICKFAKKVTFPFVFNILLLFLHSLKFGLFVHREFFQGDITKG